MKIIELVNLYKEGKIENLSKTIETKDYISFAEKYEICSSTLEACNTIDKQTGIVKADSINRKITFIITMISVYTNIEFSFDEDGDIDSIQEYDILRKNKLLKPILDTFTEEYSECEEMLNIMQKDLIENNNTTYSVIGNILASLADEFKDKIHSLNLSQDNIDKYINVFETLMNNGK